MRLLRKQRCFLICVLMVTTARVLPANQNQPSENQGRNFAVLAAQARESGNIEQAIQDYKRAVLQQDDWQEGWWYLGTLQYDSDHYAEAIPAFEKLVTLNPALGSAWEFLGLCEFETHNYDKAREDLRKGLTLDKGEDPDTSRVASYHLALLENRAGAFEHASARLVATFTGSATPQVRFALGISLLRIPLLPAEINPSLDSLIQSAGDCKVLMQQSDTSHVVDCLHDLAVRYPTTPYLHYVYGEALAKASRDVDAMDQQQQEIKVSPKSELPYIELARLEFLSKRPEDALKAAKTAVMLAESSPITHATLAEVLTSLNRKQEAESERLRASQLPAVEQRESRLVDHYSMTGSETIATAASTEGDNFEKFARQANQFRDNGNKTAAIDSYQRALKLEPNWDEGLWNLATLYYSSADYQKAGSVLRLWVQRKPADGTAWAMLGLSEFEIHDYDNALIHLQRGQEFGISGGEDSISQAKYHLAMLLNRQCDHDQAFKLLRGVQTKSPLEGETVRGLTMLRMCLLPEQLDSSKKDLVIRTGQVGELLQDSKYDQAIQKLQQLLRQYPDTPFLHYTYGKVLASLSQFEGAEQEFKRELSLSSTSALPSVQLAWVLLRQSKAESALVPAQRAVQLAVNSGEARYILGRTYFELGQNTRAIQELEIAKSLEPSSPEIRFSLAKAYAKSKSPSKAAEERAAFARLKSLADEHPERANDYTGTQMNDFSSPLNDSPVTSQPR